MGSYGILAIAVDPRRQGLGLGQILMDDAEDHAVELGFERMDLTVNPENVGGVRFYERLNWKKFYRDGMWKGVMTKDIGVRSATGADRESA
jgi:ribosomal protein S18 acetylase RimI-like enzyme